MFLRHSLLAITLLAAAFFSVSTQAQSVTGAGCDYSSAHRYNGWGWNSATRQSCEPLPDPDNSDCDYSDAGIYNGWGWNAFTQQSCPPVSNGQLLGNSLPPDGSLPLDSSLAGECIDSDGDGWGWDGVESCPLDSSSVRTTGGAETNIYAYCEDSDFDGWGWDGVTSCRKAFKLRDSDVILPPVNSVRWRTEDLVGRAIQCNKFSYQGSGTYDTTSVVTYRFMTQGSVLVSGGVYGANTQARWFITESGEIGNWANFNFPAYQTSAGYTFVSGFFINNYGPNEVSHYDVCFPLDNGSGSPIPPLRATG